MKGQSTTNIEIIMINQQTNRQLNAHRFSYSVLTRTPLIPAPSPLSIKSSCMYKNDIGKERRQNKSSETN